MKAPSDAQAALLALVAGYEARGETVEWHVEGYGDDYRPSRVVLYVEEVDRQKNTSRFRHAGHTHRVVTLRACERHGWLSLLHERSIHARDLRGRVHERTMRQLDLTEDGVIALGLWRERKLKAAPPPLPTLSDREREIVSLALRALELGYALAPCEPARKEARRMRREGWFTDCWIANNAYGLVPTGTALTEVRPEQADVAAELQEGE